MLCSKFLMVNILVNSSILCRKNSLKQKEQSQMQAENQAANYIVFVWGISSFLKYLQFD